MMMLLQAGPEREISRYASAGYGVFGEIDYEWRERDATRFEDGYKADVYGGSLGIDYAWDRGVFGVWGGYAKTTADFRGGSAQAFRLDDGPDTTFDSVLSDPTVLSSVCGGAVPGGEFDLDGALTMSGEVHAAAWAETFDRFLLEQADLHHRPYVPFDPRHDYDDLLAGRPRLDGVRLFLGSRGINLPDGASDDAPGTLSVHGLANRKNQLLQHRLRREGVAVFSGSRSFLEVVRMARLSCAVVSPSANTDLFLKLARLESLIDVQIDGAAIEIDGDPPVRQRIEGGIQGDVGTEGVIVNLIPVISAAAPGLLTMRDLFPVSASLT